MYVEIFNLYVVCGSLPEEKPYQRSADYVFVYVLNSNLHEKYAIEECRKRGVSGGEHEYAVKFKNIPDAKVDVLRDMRETMM